MIDLEHLVLDHSEQMLLLVDPANLQIVVANRVAGQVLGYTSEELLARTITEIESSLQDVFYWEHVSQGQCQNIEAQEGLYQCADGSMLTIRKSIQVLEQVGKPLLLIQARPVQNQSKIEDQLAQTLSQLRATLESTGNGILVIDWQGRIANMNRLCSNMWQIPQDLLLGRDDTAILDFIAASVVESEACRRQLREIVDSEESKCSFELHDRRIFECRSRPQFLGGNIIGRVFGYDDITEREQAEQALRESRDQLDEKVLARTADLRAANTALLAEKARQEELIRKLADAHAQLLQSEKMASIGQLAAGVAHEINNPVGFVNSNLGSLQRYVQDLLKLLAAYECAENALPAQALDEIRRLRVEFDVAYLREDIGNLISESADGLQRVKRIVQDLKDFSHVDEAERQWANLEHGLDSTLNVVWNELKYKAEIVKDYAKIAEIECFPAQLNQVFMNLLINAGHAIKNRGRITIRTGQEEANVWVEIEDSGVGIKPENLGRIFEPFFTTKPVGKGTGLGLSLAYGIVQKHSGRIEVKSEPDKGSVFRVVLPRCAGAKTAPQAQSVVQACA